MKYITYQYYLTYIKPNLISGLAEKGITYIIPEIEKIDKEHDKMFRNILSIKHEMVKMLNQFLDLKEQLELKDIVQCRTDFITSKYQAKQADVLYKMRNKPIYFLVEHQSIVDYHMTRRILEYIIEIMRMEDTLENKLKSEIYPIVVPIVIYTGVQKWRANTNFANKQYQTLNYKKYEINFEYNLVDINDYTSEELLKNESLLSSIMVIEKCRRPKELEEQMEKIIKIIKNPKEKEKMSEIIQYIVSKKIGKEKANKLIQKLNRNEEVDGMSPLQKMFLDIERKAKRKGESEGETRGKQKAMQEAIRKMLEYGETEEKIMKYTGASKKQIEEMKVIMS